MNTEKSRYRKNFLEPIIFIVAEEVLLTPLTFHRNNERIPLLVESV